jgi:hypothetical protein
MINDVEKKVKVIIDKQLIDGEWASFHPMDCTASTAIKSAGILKLKELAGRDDASYEILDFSQFASAEGEKPKPKEESKKQDKINPIAKAVQGQKMTADEKKAKKEKEKS